MQVTGTIAAMAVGMGLAACASNGGRQDVVENGVLCGQPLMDGRVHVEIRYAKDGTPSAVPEECTVARGTRITWLGPENDATPFALEFAKGSPAGRGQPVEIRSGKAANRQSIVIVAGNEQGRYKYGIQANGKLIDPAIIIDR